jgi:hypothetical protein
VVFPAARLCPRVRPGRPTAPSRGGAALNVYLVPWFFDGCASSARALRIALRTGSIANITPAVITATGRDPPRRQGRLYCLTDERARSLFDRADLNPTHTRLRSCHANNLTRLCPQRNTAGQAFWAGTPERRQVRLAGLIWRQGLDFTSPGGSG